MTAVPALDPTTLPWRTILRRAGFGFAFWLVFLLLLEPGNLVRAAHAGLAFGWPAEVLRIGCAALLGAAVSPAVFWLSGRLPVRSPNAVRHGTLLAGGLTALALTLILVGVYGSARLPPSAIRGGIGDQMAGNLLLLTAALAVLAAIAQVVGREPKADVRPAPVAGPIAVKRRGGTLLVDPASIDWIEAQGNYLALHQGPAVHLVRGVLGQMEEELQPLGFVRVHRRALVNLARVRQLQTLANGDAWLELDGDGRVRASRTYGRALRKKLMS